MLYRVLWAALCLLSLAVGRDAEVRAGAFLMREGAGQLLLGLAGISSTRRFAPNGADESAPNWRKANLGGYFEYGLTSRLTAIVAPAVSGWAGAGVPGPVGSDGSALGLRYGLSQSARDVVSLQVLLQPPLGHEDLTQKLADDGARTFAADLRVLYGRCFEFVGWPAFISLEPGGRVRRDDLPNELRFDGTLGLRPSPRWMVLLQTFETYTFAAPPIQPPVLSVKVAASLVYELSPSWSLQAGAFRTIAGFNAALEVGPFVSVWRRF